jgi:glucoamylase
MRSPAEKTKEVLMGCCCANGAIVAADSDRPDYPNQVQSYRYVWPRDAAYTCVALDMLGLHDRSYSFFKWLERAEGLKETGLLFQNYYTNGRKRWLSFQPDQNGTVLWALHEHISKHGLRKEELMPLVRLVADGICQVWDSDHFTVVSQDLWEEFNAYPEQKTTITYSVAACCYGLALANEMEPNPRWKGVSDQMRARIMQSVSDGRFVRRYGHAKDMRADISLLGLAWPFSIVAPDDPLMEATVVALKSALRHAGGYFRYEFDDYDSFRYQGTDARRGAGIWPIASFWMAKYHRMRDEHKHADACIDAVISRLDESQNIPEQLFDDPVQVSVKPLAWSHAMYLFTDRSEDSSL